MYSPSHGNQSQKKLRIEDITYYSNKRQHPFSYTRTPTSNNTMNFDNSGDSLDAGSNPNTNYIYTPTSKSRNKYQVQGNKNIRKALHQYMRQTLGDDEEKQFCGVGQGDGRQVERSKSKGNARKQDNTIAFGRTTTNASANNVCNCSCECENKSRNKKSKNYGIMRQAISARIQQYKRDHKNKKLLKTHQTIQSHLQTLNSSSPSPLSPNNSSNIPTPNKTSQQLYKKLAEKHNLSPKILVRFAQYERSKTLKKLQMRIQHYYKDKNRVPRAEEIVSPEKLGEMENAKKLVMEFQGNLGKGQNWGCNDIRNKVVEWQEGQGRQNMQVTKVQKRRQQKQKLQKQEQLRQHRQEQKRQYNERYPRKERKCREEKQIQIKEQSKNEKKMQENRKQNRYSAENEEKNKIGLHPIRIQNEYEDEPERPNEIQKGEQNRQAELVVQSTYHVHPQSKLQRLEQHSRQKRIEIIQSIQRQRIEMVEKIKIQEQLQQYQYEYQLQQYERDL